MEESKNRHNTILLAFWGQFVDHDIRWGNVEHNISFKMLNKELCLNETDTTFSV